MLYYYSCFPFLLLHDVLCIPFEAITVAQPLDGLLTKDFRCFPQL